MTARREHEEQETAPDQAATEEGAAATSAGSGTRRVLELEAEAEELRARVVRAQADYQNLRRRAQADLEAGVRRAVLPLLQELLLVVDYLDLALAVPPTTEEARNLARGVELTRTKLVQALEQAEVHPTPLPPPGGAFAPELHEATGTEPRADLAPGTVVRTVRPGYTWRGSVLRHAHVIVAAAPAGAPAPPDAPE